MKQVKKTTINIQKLIVRNLVKIKIVVMWQKIDGLNTYFLFNFLHWFKVIKLTLLKLLESTLGCSESDAQLFILV